MTDTTIVTNEQSKGHGGLGYPAAKAEAAPQVEQDLTRGIGPQAGSNRKPHAAFESNPNQYRGVDGKPTNPSEMTAEQIAEGANEAQLSEPQLTKSPEFANTYTPAPEMAPASAPTPSPSGAGH